MFGLGGATSTSDGKSATPLKNFHPPPITQGKEIFWESGIPQSKGTLNLYRSAQAYKDSMRQKIAGSKNVKF